MTIISDINKLKENHKQIGNIGEVHTIAAFVDMKIPVYIPFGDNESSDMIVDIDGYLYRVQVKATKTGTNENVAFRIHKSSGYKHNNDNEFITFSTLYNLDEIDLLALYDVNNDKLTLIEYSEVYGKRDIIVRYKNAKNNQKDGIRYYKDYTMKKTIAQLRNKHKALKYNVLKII